MVFSYLSPGSFGLRQGEILEGLFELRPVPAEEKIDFNKTAPVQKFDHTLAVVVTQDCDLDWDYKARQGQTGDDKLLEHVFLCALFPPEEIRVRGRLGHDLFKRVIQNQDERYHYFSEALIGESQSLMPKLCIDFKKVFSLPVDFVYYLTSNGYAVRKAILPAPYLHDFVHRLHAFLGRIAIPD
ncbi:MAG: hypothetical protein HYY01_08920 [Chloroflexi bacterium]|nr:hypothetical protein [Chloroflexota bacterium]